MQKLDAIFISIPIPEALHELMGRDTIIQETAKFKVETSTTELEESFIKDPEKSKQDLLHM